jgi:hypothetical protein
MCVKHGKSIINHPPVITIYHNFLVGAMFTIPTWVTQGGAAVDPIQAFRSHWNLDGTHRGWRWEDWDHRVHPKGNDWVVPSRICIYL